MEQAAAALTPRGSAAPHALCTPVIEDRIAGKARSGAKNKVAEAADTGEGEWGRGG